MPPSDDQASIDVAARAYSYEAGPGGPAFKRAIAVEAPAQIIVGGSPFAVMMTTPADLEDFAYGFALTEQIVERAEDIRGVEVEGADEGFRIKLAVTAERLKAHLARGRAIAGRTGCGLCGIEDFSQMPSPRPLPRPERPIAPAAIGAALEELDRRQPLNHLTRAVHGAAWCARDGRIALVREDVGRHNALDKAIGALLRARAAPDDGFFIITSRCSFEMVAKAAAFGATTLVSVSAPTSLALERAGKFGVSVIAVARADGALSFDSMRDEASGGLAE